MGRIGNRVVIAAPKSGGGKTTVTLGLMAALGARGLKVQGFKVGPDYIDPGFHTAVTGRPSRNLDPWLMGEANTVGSFRRACIGADISIVEGVMGLFDGRREGGEGSTAQVAMLLDAPVVLVVDAKGMGQSAAALVHGYTTFDPRVRLAGVIFNRVGSESHRRMLGEAVADIPVLGFLPEDEKINLPSRHLGLLQTSSLGGVLGQLAETVAREVDVEGVVRLAQGTRPLGARVPRPKGSRRVRLGVARDAAFSFYYQDTLDLFEDLGAELVPCSPLQDRDLPKGFDALYLGGGYPEVYARELGENPSFREGLAALAREGLPIYAECGGFIYLLTELDDTSGQSHPGVGVIPGRAVWTGKRQALGYREATVLRDTPLAPKGTQVRGHEFHYSRWEPLGEVPHAYRLQGGAEEGYAAGNILGSYLHLHLGAYPELAGRFLERAWRFREGRGWR